MFSCSFDASGWIIKTLLLYYVVVNLLGMHDVLVSECENVSDILKPINNVLFPPAETLQMRPLNMMGLNCSKYACNHFKK